jgi:indolepyruvate ferredoxin oxidoreductase alpha subunit
MAHPLISGAAGERHLLLGNEAIVRGALEAGVQVITCYPGTPSSEVPDTFFALSPDGPYSFEYSSNEKVALEVAGGSAVSGALTLCTMKHVGVNVAADPLMTLAYVGVPGGLLLLSADDPGCHSSQNEQDNRYFCRLAGLPCFEPASAQEAKEMTREALLASRAWQQPVMLRTTTRINHMRGVVEFGPVTTQPEPTGFVRDPFRFVAVPAVARARHPVLVRNILDIAEEAENSPWNTQSGEGPVGVIATGVSRTYLADALAELGLESKVAVLELGFSYPLPEKTLVSFLAERETVLVLEEGEPILETEIRALIQRAELGAKVLGKGAGGLSRLGEYSTRVVRDALAEASSVTAKADTSCAPAEGLPMRPPNLCAGCPHRATYYAVRQVYGDDAVYSSDIGCYTLGFLPPLSMADFLLCMGSSVSAGCGAAMAEGMRGDKARPVVAFIGDSTFFHSGVTGLINAVTHGRDLLFVILDNHTTAMTGHQPHPGVDTTRHGPCDNPVSIEAIVRGCGVTQVETVKPSNLKATMQALTDLKAGSGVRVLIAAEPCPLHAKKTLGHSFPRVAVVAEQSDDLTACVRQLACPAFAADDDGVRIDETLCTGCMVCLQVAGPAITTKKRGS